MTRLPKPAKAKQPSKSAYIDKVEPCFRAADGSIHNTEHEARAANRKTGLHKALAAWLAPIFPHFAHIDDIDEDVLCSIIADNSATLAAILAEFEPLQPVEHGRKVPWPVS